MFAYGKEAHGKEINTALDFVVCGACECVCGVCIYIQYLYMNAHVSKIHEDTCMFVNTHL